MNERIEKLVGRAGGIEHDDDGNKLTPALVGKDLEKFAELIVRECIDVVAKATASPNGYQALMKHFGVK